MDTWLKSGMWLNAVALVHVKTGFEVGRAALVLAISDCNNAK